MEMFKGRRGGNVRNSRVTHPDRKRRQESAAARKAAAEARTPAEQLARLDAAFGPGQGAKRERARLAAKMAGTDIVESTTKKARKRRE